MKKILIAIDSDFVRDAYSEVFQKEGYEVLSTKNGKEALTLAQKEKPNVILADVVLSEIGGFKLLKSLKEEKTTQRIPVIIFAQLERKEDRTKAIELEANDFISGASVSPAEVIRRVKIVLGEQKTYRLAIQKNLLDVKELIKDLGYGLDFKCPKCGSDLVLYLMRDLSKGENYFKASFICSKCD